MSEKQPLGRSVIESLYHYEAFNRMRTHRAEALISHIYPDGISSSEKVLEIGTGKGDMFRVLSTMYPQQITSLDIEDQVVSTNRVPGDRLIADGARLPFADDSFDSIVLCFVLHHIPEGIIPDVIQECLRTAKKTIILEDSIDGNTPLKQWLTEFYVKGFDKTLNLTVPGGGMANQKQTKDWCSLFKQVGGIPYIGERFTHKAIGFIPLPHQIITLTRSDK
jgi:ubiquinone/menaquinone biosynthesis C-methylase UbiE